MIKVSEMNKGFDPYNHVPTQHERILAYLEQRKSITLIECMQDLRITKLQTRLGELRVKGYIFPDKWEGNGIGRHKRYFAPTKTPRAI